MTPETAMARFASEVSSVSMATLDQNGNPGLGIIGQPCSLHVVLLPSKVGKIGNLCNTNTCIPKNLRVNENKEPDRVSHSLRHACLVSPGLVSASQKWMASPVNSNELYCHKSLDRSCSGLALYHNLHDSPIHNTRKVVEKAASSVCECTLPTLLNLVDAIPECYAILLT